MDSDAPHPHCPFCGLPMQISRAGANSVNSVFAAFDCKWCGVVLNVMPHAEVIQLASVAASVRN